MIHRPQAAVLTVAALLAATVTGASHASAGATQASTDSTSSAVTHKVIVLLKDQPEIVSTRSSAFSARRTQILDAQAPLTRQLQSAASTHVKSYSLLNAVSATVSATEESALKADPAVASVVPDEVIKLPAADTTKTAAAAPAGTTRTPAPGTCGTAAAPLLEPEALGVTHTQSDDPTAKTARSLGYTGKGVKVAYMAEGIDIKNPDFIRADGSSVFSDYQDFSSDGINAPTGAGEAFLDASAIAAQGLHTYDIQNFTADPLSTPCDIRVEGIAPGVSLVGLKVFAANNATTTSGFVQAIDYAATVDKVDVLNESFGNNPFPDTATADAVALFNNAAVKAGVTVVASSGDAGPTNTIGSPATDPKVISVGASTTFKFYAQTGYGGYFPLAKGGWLNDNISPLSSSGTTESGRTIDLIAPGDLDWALCTPDATLYADCTDDTGTPSSVEESGGTSEAAPLTSGAAALVIEAYRDTHKGKSPTPAEVKQLITGTADDLGHPAAEQGAGRLNTYQAVLAAQSLHDGNGSPAPTGSTVLKNKTQIDASAPAGTKVSTTLTLTNNGKGTQSLSLNDNTLGPVLESTTGSVTLADSNTHFTDFAGQQVNYQVAHFTVKPSRARLDVDLVYPGDPAGSLNGRVRLALIDPKGRFAAHSLPQGVGDAGHVDVRNPASGSWTAMIWSRGSAVGGTVGKVTYKATTHNYVTAGTVSPSKFTLKSGASKTVTVAQKTASKPGDQTNSVHVKIKGGQTTSIPVALRSLVNLKTGGAYSGTLTGGNGRESITGQTGYYQFTVPKGEHNLTANFSYAKGVTDPVFAYLVDPAGNAQAYTANAQVTGFDSTTGAAITKPLSSLSAYVRSPAAGKWTLILDFAPAVSGKSLSSSFSGTIVVNKVKVTSKGLPNSSKTKLKAGKTVTVPVTVKNTGKAPEYFFVDARTNSYKTLTIAPEAPSPTALPLTPTTVEPQWNVPTETTKVNVKVTASAPVNFDFGWNFGAADPDIEGISTGKTATGSYSGTPVPAGGWFATPAEIGPFPASGAPAATATASMTATTRGFDSAVSTPIGDFEATAVDPTADFQIVVVKPGKSLTIPVSIKPTAKKGTVVSGQLYLDDLTVVSVVGTVPSAEELSALPYRYTVS